VVSGFSRHVHLTAGEITQVLFSSNDTGALRIRADPSVLWWPAQMAALGAPTLHNLSLLWAADTSEGGGAVGGGLVSAVGLRDVQKELEQGNALFSVNGHRILIRGGGWAPDLLLRATPERTAAELGYVLDLGLNTVRLEGKFQEDDLFEQADRLGILMLPGICCCDAWQQWEYWGKEQHMVASHSVRSQVRRPTAPASYGVGVLLSTSSPR
jgi:exo-1,4-beta-D-glucosaminidase